jgi:hypothetical protein
MDPMQMRKMFVNPPEQIFVNLNPMPFNMVQWTELIARYTDQLVIRVRVKDDMQLLRTAIKDHIEKEILRNYTYALMLRPSCIRQRFN